MIWIWLACAEDKLTIETETSRLTDPEITAITWVCDAETDSWTFEMKTNAWTSNGHIWITDGSTTERHYIQSIGAPADGSADNLELILEIVADWRDAEAGKRTQFRCRDENELSLLASVMHPETGEITDCFQSNAFDWREIEGSPSCDQSTD
jgi:hypothetical protein